VPFLGDDNHVAEMPQFHCIPPRVEDRIEHIMVKGSRTGYHAIGSSRVAVP
jgi:hypothetical protein